MFAHIPSVRFKKNWELMVCLFWVMLPIGVFFLMVWQDLQVAFLQRQIRKLGIEKEELIRKNDDLKIGIVIYTSAERIEALYRKTYSYLPISLGNKIVTVELPPLPYESSDTSPKSSSLFP